jgi:hypothetical protein
MYSAFKKKGRIGVDSLGKSFTHSFGSEEGEIAGGLVLREREREISVEKKERKEGRSAGEQVCIEGHHPRWHPTVLQGRQRR